MLPLLPLIASNVEWHYSVLLDLRHSIIEVNESNTQDVNRVFTNLITTETLVLSLYLSKFANACSLTLREESFVIINCCRINYYGTYFGDFGPKSQKSDPQNIVFYKSIARISSAKYGFKANPKTTFHISKFFYSF